MAELEPLEPLSPSLSKLLDAERPLRAVPAAAKARMAAKIASTLGGPTGGGGGGSGGQPAHPGAGHAGRAASSASTWGTAAVTKLAVGVGVVSFAVGGAVGVGAHAVMQAPVPPPSPIAQLTPPVPPSAPLLAPAPVPEPTPVPAPVVAPAPPLAPVVTPKPPPPRPDDLGQERSLVDQARSALARKDFASALSALSDHERRFAKGQLAEERSALKVVALSGAGRADDARAAAAAFRARWPDSLLMPLVDGTR